MIEQKEAVGVKDTACEKVKIHGMLARSGASRSVARKRRRPRVTNLGRIPKSGLRFPLILSACSALSI
jgi:hypothetical protein